MTTKDLDKRIIKIVLEFLAGEDTPTTETLHKAVYDVVEMFQKRKEFSDEESVNLDQLIKEVETLCNVYVPHTSKLNKYIKIYFKQ
jgi:hypothetical protein